LLQFVSGLKLFSTKIVGLFYVSERTSTADILVPVYFYKHKEATINADFTSICIRL